MNTETQQPLARLLVVDDDPAHMTALYRTLEDAGYDVTAFTSAGQAVQTLIKRERQFDLILTDLRMPEMDGISLLRHAQDIDPSIVGVLMTGHGAIETAIEAMKAGALDYVLKPFKLSTITPILNRALEVRRLRVEVGQLQQRVQEHVRELEASNKELESFSYSVSHDLRAPLRAINGFSEMLAESYGVQLPSEGQQLLDRIRQNALRMGQLIEHLLRFSQLIRQPLTKRPVDVAVLVNEVLNELAAHWPQREVELKVGVLPSTEGDPVLLRQVFANLLSNAFKFTSRVQHPIIQISGEKQGAHNLYCVRDNGAGFDMQYAQNLFRVFHRLHSNNEFEGTGVGLSLVQRIVQRHGGHIWAEAALGKGAVFYFTLPSVET